MFLLGLDINYHQENGIPVKPDIKIIKSGGNGTGLHKEALQTYQIKRGKLTDALLGMKRMKRDGIEGIFQTI